MEQDKLLALQEDLDALAEKYDLEHCAFVGEDSEEVHFVGDLSGSNIMKTTQNIGFMMQWAIIQAGKAFNDMEKGQPQNLQEIPEDCVASC